MSDKLKIKIHGYRKLPVLQEPNFCARRITSFCRTTGSDGMLRYTSICGNQLTRTKSSGRSLTVFRN